MATDLDASHRVFPPLTLKPCYLPTSPRQNHPLGLRTGHMPHEEEVWGEKIFSYAPFGTLHCQQGATLYPQERRPEHDGTVRVLYAARIADCRSCPLRVDCQGHAAFTKKPRRVSAVLHPLPQMIPEEQPPSPLSALASHPVLWGDWSRGPPRRAWIQWQRSHLVTVEVASIPLPCSPPAPFSRAERAHWRLTWQQRLARNVRPPTAPPVKITVYGLSSQFAQALGFPVAVPLTA